MPATETAGELRPLLVGRGSARALIPTRDQMRSWGAKSSVSLVDQALTSAAGFGANVLVARWTTTAQYGAFAVAFAGYLFLTTFHNALLLEPLSVIGPARHAENLRAYFRAQLRVHGVLVWPLSGLTMLAAMILYLIAPRNPLIGALIGGALSLPVLLLLWLARRMCYVLQRPALATAGSSVYLVVTLSGLVLLRARDSLVPFSAFLAVGIGSLLGACVILFVVLRRFEARGREYVPLALALSENWNYGRWLLGSALLYAISTSIQTFFVAGAIGLTAAGVLRAMQVPSLAMTQTIAAMGLLVLPALSFNFGKGQFARLRNSAILVSAALGAAAILFAILLALGDSGIERILYGGKYSGYISLIPILALIPVANGLCTGYSMALRASQKPYFDLIANAAAAPVAIISTIVLVHRWGVLGAAVSMVLSFVAMNAVTIFFFLRTGTRSDQAVSRLRSDVTEGAREIT